MSTSPLSLVSENEYLHTGYRPDCDYVDGFVLERNLGPYRHARLQSLILACLIAREKAWQVHVVVECRLKIRPRKYRVPDVMVLPAAASYPSVIEQPPLLCIEVVSPDDRRSDLVLRAGEYLTLGVPATWIFDPENKRTSFTRSRAQSSLSNLCYSTAKSSCRSPTSSPNSDEK